MLLIVSMAAVYLDDFARELAQVGEVGFRRRYVAPVLILTGRAVRGGRAGSDGEGRGRRAVTVTTDRGGAPLGLIHRVFPVVKSAHAAAGPVCDGRTSENDVVIADYSISKR